MVETILAIGSLLITSPSLVMSIVLTPAISVVSLRAAVTSVVKLCPYLSPIALSISAGKDINALIFFPDLVSANSTASGSKGLVKATESSLPSAEMAKGISLNLSATDFGRSSRTCGAAPVSYRFT